MTDTRFIKELAKFVVDRPPQNIRCHWRQLGAASVDAALGRVEHWRAKAPASATRLNAFIKERPNGQRSLSPRRCLRMMSPGGLDGKDHAEEVRSQGPFAQMSQTSPSLSKFSRFARHSRTFSVTGTFLRRQLWVWPLIAAVVLAGLAWGVMAAVEGVMRKQVAAELTAIRDADVTALRVWSRQHEADARLLAMSDRVRPAVTELMAHADSDAALRQSPRQAELRVSRAAHENVRLHRFLRVCSLPQSHRLVPGRDDRCDLDRISRRSDRKSFANRLPRFSTLPQPVLVRRREG